MFPHPSVPTWLLTRYFRLRKKYNEINLQLGQTGAGLSFEELNENEKTRTLLGQYTLSLWAYTLTIL